MKHLKKFNESNTLDVIKDICIELEDLEFKMSYQKNPEFGNSITIFGYYEGSNSVYDRDMRMIVKGTNFNSIKDCILRLKDYLGDNYDEMLIMSHAWVKADFEKYNNKRVLGVVILFKDEIEGSPEGDGGSGLSFLKDIYEI